MSVVSARRLIVAYAALFALLDLFALLPGSPLDSRGIIGAVAIQALVVGGLWHGSWLAWLAAMAFAGARPPDDPGPESPLEADVILVFVVSIAQVAILCIRPIRPLARGAALGRPA